MMKFYRGYKYKGPRKRGSDRLRKKRFLAQFRNDLLLVTVLCLQPGQSPHPTSLRRPVPVVEGNALIKQADDAVDVLQRLHHLQDFMAKEVEKT